MASGATTTYGVLSPLGVFTAPMNGLYDFSGSVSKVGAVNVQLGLAKNGASFLWAANSAVAGARISASFNGTRLKAGDTVHLQVDYAANPNFNSGASSTWFSGYLVNAQ